MTLLHIIQCLNLGGMEKASAQFCRLIQSRGHTVDWLSLNKGGALVEAPDLAGYRVDCLNYERRNPLKTYLEQRHSFSSRTYDRVLMSGHNLCAMLALPRSGKDRRVLAQHYHHGGVKWRPSWNLIYAIALQRFRWITFASQAIRQEAISISPDLEKRSTVVRYPMAPRQPATPTERLQARRAFGAENNEVIIGNAGWLIQRKRFDVFLNVAKTLVNRGTNVLGIIAGGGPLEAELRASCAELGLSSRIRFTGWLADLDQFYKALDVLLFSTDWDAFPMTPQEAMSRGVPVVASSLFGGLSELYSAESPIKLNHSHDIQSLADGVERAVAQRSSVTQYQTNRLRLLCDPQTVGDELCNLLEL